MRVPNGLSHRFDQQPIEEGTRVQKTTSRQVVTLELSAFHAVEVVRTTSDHQRRRSSLLAGLVPKGGKYGYDLITHVGIQAFLHGRELRNIAAELSPLPVPFSSLHDLLMKFCITSAIGTASTPHPVCGTNSGSVGTPPG